VATREEVVAVLEMMRDRLGDADVQERVGAHSRSVQFDCTDLEASFAVESEGGGVVSLREASLEAPDIRVTCESDTLVGIAEGRIDAMSAFMSGQLQVKAAFTDLMKLQRLF
jgi:putative sterol carrier protein